MGVGNLLNLGYRGCGGFWWLVVLMVGGFGGWCLVNIGDWCVGIGLWILATSAWGLVCGYWRLVRGD